MKKAISLLTAMAIAAPIIPAVFADDEPTTSTPEVTVVGKRIIDGDPYFEISLEVNGDYEDYSGVSVVLEYDPQYIVPAESWDEGATQADMSENDSWATRRALPTLGKDTWTSHTALAYEAKDEVSGKKTGYLYLGAEYPGQIPSTAAPGATAAPAASDPDATAEPSAEPNDDPYTNPVVVARFMYAAPTTYGDSTKTAEDVSDERASTKEALEDMWQYGAHPTPAAEADRVNWDTDWSKNTILTIAPDAIAFESPAQFPFAYYDANFDERAFMFDFPTPVPTIDAAATAVPTGMPVPTPVHNQYPSGSRIAEDNQLTKDDINIVLGLGKSAKATGGLSLSDIFVILFYDWDNSFIGTLTAGIGAENMEKTVSDYVEKNLVYPDLRKQDATDLASYARKDSYRGVYPYTSPADGGSNPQQPGGSNTVEDGEKFPLTNKLDYVFAGKTYHENAPYAGGWTRVTTDNIETTYSWFSQFDYKNSNIFGLMPEYDESSGLYIDAKTGLPSSSVKPPTMISYDFSDIKESDLDGGVMMVKAVYIAGDKLGDGYDYYTIDDNGEITTLTQANVADKIFGASYSYRRVNQYGYGVTRLYEPKVRMTFQQIGASGDAIQQVDCDNSEVIDVLLALAQNVLQANHQLVDKNNATIVSASKGSDISASPFVIAGPGGIVEELEKNKFWDQCYNLDQKNAVFDYTAAELADMGYVYQYKNGKQTAFSSNASLNAFKTYVKKFYTTAKAAPNNQTDPYTYTYYQIQYAIITQGKTYMDPDGAEDFCKKNYPWVPGYTG